MAGAGATVLLREENGCCSRRQSSSSAGDSDGEREDSAVAVRARRRLEGLLNKNMRIRMTDGRTLVGCFLCTDRDCNVILGSAQEFLKPTGQIACACPCPRAWVSPGFFLSWGAPCPGPGYGSWAPHRFC
ncbi:N-alpha-acetyltransferase 38, NatC auxiliary subunit isoform X1 [Petaurus breviceps papuanus]|uniref:N-alpha-acetyltransferase 38, NatC auxiliary subunit isoform X1 n=1 Tax=Petaurus breviceps papuanus TaxID=3040969 RepID=UPI0036DD3A73